MQIVDLATLTGACVVALGPSIAGRQIFHDHALVDSNWVQALRISASFCPFILLIGSAWNNNHGYYLKNIKRSIAKVCVTFSNPRQKENPTSEKEGKVVLRPLTTFFLHSSMVKKRGLTFRPYSFWNSNFLKHSRQFLKLINIMFQQVSRGHHKP